MEAKLVQFTHEHLLFIWKRFRYIKESELNWYFSLDEINTNGCCVEIRKNKELIACGTLIGNNLEFSVVSEDERGKNLQIKLMNARIEYLKENTNFKEVEMNVRCHNISSWMNALKCGFKIKSQMRYSNDDEGFVLTKSINQ